MTIDVEARVTGAHEKATHVDLGQMGDEAGGDSALAATLDRDDLAGNGESRPPTPPPDREAVEQRQLRSGRLGEGIRSVV